MNYKNKKFAVFVFLFISLNSFSQTISGKITNEVSEPLSANIIIKDSENRNEVSEFFRANSKGEFTANLKKNYAKIFFEITAFGYESTAESIINPDKNKVYNFNYTLKKETTQLKEVVVVSEKKKFVVKDDTIKFNPSAYRDGTERKVEDLIKKLPGMEVAENGTIKYKGKTVESVQIEGDNLFGYNYAIGTKNISVDMVEQVQAIENYVENPLLKGIVNSDNVSINLKLKKSKVDLSGNGNFGLPIATDKFITDTSINLLGISKKYKSFGEFGFNNIGINNTIFDYFSNNSNLDREMNDAFYTKKAISEKNYATNLENIRTNVNNQLNLNYNIIYRFNKNLSLKANLYFIKDKLSLLESNNTFYKTENIIYNDDIQTIKKPDNKTIDLKLTYNTTKKSLLEFDTKFEKEVINTNSTILQNQSNEINTNLESKSLFWKNKLQYTYRISTNKALQFISTYAINDIPQELSFNQTYFSFAGNLQKSEFQKQNISNKLLLLGGKKSFKFVFLVGLNLENNKQNSEWLQNNNLILGFQNQFNYKKNTLYSDIGFTYVRSKFKFEPSLIINNINQDYNDFISNLNITKSSLIFLPNLTVSYLVNAKSSINISGNYEETTPNLENLYSNSIIQDNRLIQKNVLNLNLLKNQSYSLRYKFSDLFNSLLTNFSLNYNLKNNTYISSFEIQNNYNTINYFQSPTDISDYSAKLTIEKYFKFIKTSIKHSSNYNISNYINSINGNLRNNTSNNYNAYLFLKTTFKLPVNFENKFNYNRVNFKSENNINTNESLNNSTKILIRPYKNWLCTFSYEYFLPNMKINTNFKFLDFDIKFKPKQKWLNLTLSAKNLLNNKIYFQVQNTDYYTSVYQSNLINRYFLLTADFTL
ncbi:conserved exported hypothetical protein [Flavobacterium psychrophilum]|uniref:hypothetical protein n=1 Tax=Flavobacterium psychrophilum TaxID=96345 RepID=UPI000B7C5566|nr:hypothetical protein [Flavobacterium psychrophilum]SNB31080.1 conserved exported hypothetical protein [Flavobacterium psychrophilum]